MSGDRKALVLASVSVASWATVATAFKIALRQMDVVQMLTIASVTATMVFAVWLTVTGQWGQLRHISGRTWGKLAMLGALNPVAYYIFLFSAYDYLPAQIAQPLNYMWPILLVIMLAVIGRKAIPGRKYVGLVVSFAGLVVISVFGSAVGGLSISLLGVALALGSAFLWATYWLVNDRLKTEVSSESVVGFCGFLFGSIYMAGIASVWALACATPAVNVSGLLAGVYIGCFEMGVPFLCFGIALRTTSNPVLINQLCYLSPFLSLALIAWVLGEPIAWTTIVGLCLIVLGVALNARSR